MRKISSEAKNGLPAAITLEIVVRRVERKQQALAESTNFPSSLVLPAWTEWFTSVKWPNQNQMQKLLVRCVWELRRTAHYLHWDNIKRAFYRTFSVGCFEKQRYLRHSCLKCGGDQQRYFKERLLDWQEKSAITATEFWISCEFTRRLFSFCWPLGATYFNEWLCPVLRRGDATNHGTSGTNILRISLKWRQHVFVWISFETRKCITWSEIRTHHFQAGGVRKHIRLCLKKLPDIQFICLVCYFPRLSVMQFMFQCRCTLRPWRKSLHGLIRNASRSDCYSLVYEKILVRQEREQFSPESLVLLWYLMSVILSVKSASLSSEIHQNVSSFFGPSVSLKPLAPHCVHRIGVARGAYGAMSPSFRTFRHFVLWEAVFPTK